MWLTCNRRLIFAAAVMFGSSVLPTAQARPQDDDLPWGRGTLVPSLGLGGSFGGSIGQLAISVGASYFVANGLAVGLTLSDQIWFYSAELKQAYPGINQQLPNNEFGLRPNLQYIFFRNRYFSPYAVAGVGPVFLNHGGGTLGEWHAGPGFYIGIGGPVFLNLGVVFSGRFPGSRCEAAYTYHGANEAVYFTNCGFAWGIRGGLVFALGMRKKKSQPPPPAPRYQPATPAPEYSRPASGYPEPTPGYTEPAPAQPQPAPVQPTQPPVEPPVESAPPESGTTQPVQPAQPEPSPPTAEPSSDVPAPSSDVPAPPAAPATPEPTSTRSEVDPWS